MARKIQISNFDNEQKDEKETIFQKLKNEARKEVLENIEDEIRQKRREAEEEISKMRYVAEQKLKQKEMDMKQKIDEDRENMEQDIERQSEEEARKIENEWKKVKNEKKKNMNEILEKKNELDETLNEINQKIEEVNKKIEIADLKTAEYQKLYEENEYLKKKIEQYRKEQEKLKKQSTKKDISDKVKEEIGEVEKSIFDIIEREHTTKIGEIILSESIDQKQFLKLASRYKTEQIHKEGILLENDDKTYTAAETLKLCKALNIPMVLDVHHHNCNNNGENINDIWAEIVNTWNDQPLPPKIHFSSPREGKFDRKHADYIDVNEFASFLNLAKESVNNDFDVMIEAKKKDLALFKLIDDLRKINYPCEFIDESTIKI